MRRLAVASLIVSLALLGAAAGARSEPRSFSGSVWVGITGWGSVEATKGAIGHPTASCLKPSCGAANYLLKRPRVVLVATPYKGWRFSGWRRACKKTKKPRCVLDASHARKDSFGEHSVRAAAKFIPVAPGLTRAHPIPLGTAADIGDGFVARVNSANASVQLSTPPPAGGEYFDANLTVTYTGHDPEGQNPIFFGLGAEGSQKARYYTDDGNGCSDPGPQPPLDPSGGPLLPGQSTTGYVCWTIAASDAGSLELFFGSGTFDLPRTTWFALH